jgi:hypothetical protein
MFTPLHPTLGPGEALPFGDINHVRRTRFIFAAKKLDSISKQRPVAIYKFNSAPIMSKKPARFDSVSTWRVGEAVKAVSD